MVSERKFLHLKWNGNTIKRMGNNSSTSSSSSLLNIDHNDLTIGKKFCCSYHQSLATSTSDPLFIIESKNCHSSVEELNNEIILVEDCSEPDAKDSHQKRSSTMKAITESVRKNFSSIFDSNSKKLSQTSRTSISTSWTSLTTSNAPQNVQHSDKTKMVNSPSRTSMLFDEPQSSDDSVEVLEKLRLELRNAKRQVYEREQQLLKLHREIHKLKSVLEHSNVIQTIQKSDTISDSNLKNTPGQTINDNNHHETSNIVGFNNKKKGVSGESFESSQAIGSFELKCFNFVRKDFDCRRLIQEALMDNSFLKNYLNQEQIDLIVDAMYEKEFPKNCYICRCGTYGSHLYVVSQGDCEVIDSQDHCINQISSGKAFGELALLYNCTRTASVKTLTKVRSWVLDRRIFQMIMMKTGLDRVEYIKKFLQNVSFLQNLTNEKMSKLVDVVQIVHYPSGEYICRQGMFGDSFYIIAKGTVQVTQIRTTIDDKQKNHSTIKEDIIRKLSKGDYFGEQALLLGSLGTATTTCTGVGNTISPPILSIPNCAVRTANVISNDCECLVLDQMNFFSLLGDLHEIRYKSYTSSDYKRQINDIQSSAIINTTSTSLNQAKSNIDQQPQSPKILTKNSFIQNLKLNDLESIAPLGMGGFGTVNLVRCQTEVIVASSSSLSLNNKDSKPNNTVFALKRCSKKFIRATHQQQHIINEKLVMERIAGRCPFVIELFRTFQDHRSVYFLMESALGGELWTILRRRGPFNEPTVRFYVGCVICALEYLHSKKIIYRDLKPENCLLDARGYLKLTDFGFSKFLTSSEKTWTFCGTEEYVAPEIILNRGHDKAVDVWSLGILIYELLTGRPPFISNEPLQTYHMILRGFDSISFDENIFSKHCVNLIRNLCRENPNERLGIRGRHGHNDIKRHHWFIGFNWIALAECRMTAPIIPKLSSNIDICNFDVITNNIKSDNQNIDYDQRPDEKSLLSVKSFQSLSLTSVTNKLKKKFSFETNHENDDVGELSLYDDDDSTNNDWENYF